MQYDPNVLSQFSALQQQQQQHQQLAALFPGGMLAAADPYGTGNLDLAGRYFLLC